MNDDDARHQEFLQRNRESNSPGGAKAIIAQMRLRDKLVIEARKLRGQMNTIPHPEHPLLSTGFVGLSSHCGSTR